MICIALGFPANEKCSGGNEKFRNVDIIYDMH
jgi:hypothetical protein